jgi:hypothetical protein
METLVVKLFARDPVTNTELELARSDSDKNALLDHAVQSCLKQAVARATAGEIKPFTDFTWVEVSVDYSTDDPLLRHTVHLSVETIDLLAKARASFDFDPYVYCHPSDPPEHDPDKH